MVKERKITLNTLSQRVDALEIKLNDLDRRMTEGFARIEKNFEDLMIMLVNQFTAIDKRFEALEYEVSVIKQNMATKDDIRELDSHIGRLEIRFQKIEDIVLNDHRPRIKNLEKEVGI
jgi:predicted  nucleic acid-binding Zn-ribbon protein